MSEEQKIKLQIEIQETLDRVSKEEDKAGDLYSIIRWARQGFLTGKNW